MITGYSMDYRTLAMFNANAMYGVNAPGVEMTGESRKSAGRLAQTEDQIILTMKTGYHRQVTSSLLVACNFLQY